MTGYDAETGKLVAERLGVEPCFVTPPWSDVTAGNWGDRWDVAWGSGALTGADGAPVGHPAVLLHAACLLRPADSPDQEARSSRGRRSGPAAGLHAGAVPQPELELPGAKLEFVVDDPTIVTFEAEPPGLAAPRTATWRRSCAASRSAPRRSPDGARLRKLAPPAYTTQKTGYVDRGSSLADGVRRRRWTGILGSSTLTGRSRSCRDTYFGRDHATAAGAFDMAGLDQSVE